jgi:hypothetical protein
LAKTEFFFEKANTLPSPKAFVFVSSIHVPTVLYFSPRTLQLQTIPIPPQPPVPTLLWYHEPTCIIIPGLNLKGSMSHEANWTSTSVCGLCWISDPQQAHIKDQRCAANAMEEKRGGW